MSVWKEPKNDYNVASQVTPGIFNELAENERYLKETLDTKITMAQVEDAEIVSDINQKRINIGGKEKIKIAFGIIRKWFSDLKALAFKDKVSDDDIINISAIKVQGLHSVATTGNYNELNNKPNITKEAVGLDNVDNIKQYSPSNQPPYPVTSVNGMTGAVNIQQMDLASIVNAIYPVGSIKITTTNTNPQAYLVGSWTSWGNGRVPLGVDDTQYRFNASEKLGGEYEHALTPAESVNHTHGYVDRYFGWQMGKTYDVSTGKLNVITVATNIEANKTTVGIGDFYGNAHNNIQPYITCYMWKRIS